ncbi:putative membrane protein [Neisseria musculi]|uniref:Membrane protein n=1 Tax=Neisseria musculi TaxID=1815583 RepID=A0A7H1MBA5_9NEIS|nr:putative membrane protein [Neisseria musculi]
MNLMLFRLIGLIIGWVLYYIIYKATSWPNYAYIITALVLVFFSIYFAEKFYYRLLK